MQRFVIALGVFTAACGSSKPAAVTARAAPTLAVVASPTTIAHGETVTFAVTVTHHKIVDPRPGLPPRDGEGHYHYYLDDAVRYTAGWTPTVTFKSLETTPPGPHTMRFVLATNEHEEVMPVVETTVTFTVQ